MKPLDLQETTSLIEKSLSDLHARRTEVAKNITLPQLLHHNNSFLIRAKYGIMPYDAFKILFYEYYYRQEVELFERFMKELAISLCQLTREGKQSALEGIDLEFVSDGITYLVVVKSDSRWWFTQDIHQMQQCFRKSKKAVQEIIPQAKISCVEGFCFGKYFQPPGKSYSTLCGADFWKLISGSEDLFPLIEPLRKQMGNLYNEETYDRIIGSLNLCHLAFIETFHPSAWQDVADFNAK